MDLIEHLEDVGAEVLRRDEPILRGHTIETGAVLAGSPLSALYASAPVAWPDSFARCGAVAMVWLVPVHGREADYVARHGWNAFEDRLLEAQPDLFDLAREPVA